MTEKWNIYFINRKAIEERKHMGIMFGGDHELDFEEDYEKVAIVETPYEYVYDALETVFQTCNHIDHDWTSNSNVLYSANGNGIRSMMVGDIAQDERSGAFYMVKSVGWEEINIETLK